MKDGIDPQIDPQAVEPITNQLVLAPSVEPEFGSVVSFDPFGSGIANEREAYDPFTSGFATRKSVPPSLNPNKRMTKEEFAIDQQEQADKPFLEKAGEVISGVGTGLWQMGGTALKAIPETVGTLGEGDYTRFGKTMIEASAQGLMGSGEMLEDISGRTQEFFMNDEEALDHSYNRYLDNLDEAEYTQEGLMFDASETDPNTVATASMLLDPANLAGLGITGKAVKAFNLSKTAQKAGKILDMPHNIIRGSLEKGMKGVAKTAQGALFASRMPLKGAEWLGGGLEYIGSAPVKLARWATPSKMFSDSDVLGGAVRLGMWHMGPIGQTFLGTELVGHAFAKSAKIGRQAETISGILGDFGRRERFLQAVQLSPDVSPGIKLMAKRADNARSVELTMNAISNGVTAGTLQGIITKLSTDDTEVIGQAMGGGGVFGGMTAPIGPKRGNRPVKPSDNPAHPVSDDFTTRQADLVEIEQHRQADGANEFNNEKNNMSSYNHVFDTQKTDARPGKEGTTFPEGSKVFYSQRGEGEGLKYMYDIEDAIQLDKISNVTFVTTASTDLAGRKKKKSVIEPLSANVIWLDTQANKGTKDNNTLTSGRAINFDNLRAVAFERGLDINFLAGEVKKLKDHVRSGGQINDKKMKSNEINKLLKDGEVGIINQIDPRNIVYLGDKAHPDSINPPVEKAPTVMPDVPLTPAQTKAIKDGVALPKGVKPQPKHLIKSAKPIAEAKVQKVVDVKRGENQNIPDFTGDSRMTLSLSQGANGHISAKFRKGVDKSLYRFHNIAFRKKGNAMNRKSAKPTDALIKQEQQYLADIYEIPFKDVPALAKKFHDHVKAKGKTEHKKDRGDFRAPQVKDFI